MWQILLGAVLLLSCSAKFEVNCKSDKYGAEANLYEKDLPKKYGERLNYHARDNMPFRSEKLNLVWSKALKVFISKLQPRFFCDCIIMVYHDLELIAKRE